MGGKYACTYYMDRSITITTETKSVMSRRSSYNNTWKRTWEPEGVVDGLMTPNTFTREDRSLFSEEHRECLRPQ